MRFFDCNCSFGPSARPALALLVDDMETSAAILRAKKFVVLTEADLEQM